jgi:multicomponent Na+:H+ antiporter subunit E
MSILLLNIFLALVWVALTGKLSTMNFITGFVLAYCTLWLTVRRTESRSYFSRVPKVIGFLLFFIKELVLANLRVAYDVLTPRHHMKPGVIAIELDAKTDTEITLLANLITLTPGTLSLDVSKDRSVLYVHAMYIDDVDKARKTIKEGFEQRLLEILR